MVPGGAAGHVVGPLAKPQRWGSVAGPRRDLARRSITSPHLVAGGLRSSMSTMPEGGLSSPHKAALVLQRPEIGRLLGARCSLDLPTATIGSMGSSSAASTVCLPLAPISQGLRGSGRTAVSSSVVVEGAGAVEASAIPDGVEGPAAAAKLPRRMAAALRMLVPGCVRGLIEDSNLDFINE